MGHSLSRATGKSIFFSRKQQKGTDQPSPVSKNARIMPMSKDKCLQRQTQNRICDLWRTEACSLRVCSHILPRNTLFSYIVLCGHLMEHKGLQIPNSGVHSRGRGRTPSREISHPTVHKTHLRSLFGAVGFCTGNPKCTYCGYLIRSAA